jgi:multiple sugar transport system substrate-binding protein
MNKHFSCALLVGTLALLSGTAALTQADQPYAGQTISLLLPPWGTLSKSMLDRFETDTGIKVEMQTLGWDEIRSKILTSMVAGTAPADITELDWSWVGQFGAAGWYTPLEGMVDQKLVADIAPSSIFTYNKQLLGVPYANDFRVVIFNKAMFAKAGIKKLPTTPQELFNAAKILKQKGVVKYPIGVPLSATEGSSTAWYLLTKAFGGELFSSDFKPLFTNKTSAGFKALQWEIDALKAKLIDPAQTGLTDVQTQELFKAGKIAIDLAGWPGNLPVYNDAKKSKIAGQASAMLVPGVGGKSRTFGLPEALGIPSNSEHKEAAFEFIKWWMQPENTKQVYSELGDLPTRTSVLQDLNKQGKLESGTVLIKQLSSVEPLFAQGTPEWFPQFSGGVASIINRAAKGQLSVEQAVQQIAQQAQKAKQR